MKKSLFSAVMCGALIFISRPAAGAEVAAGIVLGEPTGFSIRINNFPVLGFGWSISRDYMFVNCDYWVINKPFPNADPLYWYLGVGGALGIGGHESALGCRVPIGLQAIFNRKYEVFGEIAPGLGVAPDVEMFVQGGIGFRYIF
jgi:hypothetical protein